MHIDNDRRTSQIYDFYFFVKTFTIKGGLIYRNYYPKCYCFDHFLTNTYF